MTFVSLEEMLKDTWVLYLCVADLIFLPLFCWEKLGDLNRHRP